jgi:hypothetical protein
VLILPYKKWFFCYFDCHEVMKPEELLWNEHPRTAWVTRQGVIREGERLPMESGTMGIAGTSAHSSTVPIERTMPQSHLTRVNSPVQQVEQRAFRQLSEVPFTNSLLPLAHCLVSLEHPIITKIYI